MYATHSPTSNQLMKTNYRLNVITRTGPRWDEAIHTAAQCIIDMSELYPFYLG